MGKYNYHSTHLKNVRDENYCSNVPDLTATIHEDDLDNTSNTVDKLTNIVELDENQEMLMNLFLQIHVSLISCLIFI